MDNLNAAMGDFYFENEDLVELYERMEDGDGTYEEIAEYFDNHIPDWRKNKGLGQWAPEFITGYWDQYESYQGEMDELEEGYEEDEEEEDGNQEKSEREERMSLFEWLEDMKEDILRSYERTQSSYQVVRNDLEYERYLEDSGLEDTDELRAEFSKEDDEEVYLGF